MSILQIKRGNKRQMIGGPSGIVGQGRGDTVRLEVMGDGDPIEGHHGSPGVERGRRGQQPERRTHRRQMRRAEPFIEIACKNGRLGIIMPRELL